MKIPNALFEAACDATAVVCRLDQPADAALSAFFRQHRNLGSHDRPFIADTVYAVLRNKRLLEALTGGTTPERLVIAALVKLQGLSGSALDPLVSARDKRWLPEIRQARSDQFSAAVRWSLPDWLWQRLHERYGDEEARALARALLMPAPLDLRVNTLLASRDGILSTLTADGIHAAPTPYSPWGIRLREKPSLNRHELFLGGKFEVQDEGSQLLALLVGPTRREMVVDFCAGAGGKTLALGAMMHNQGRLYAFDVSTRRLDALKQRLKRSGLSNVQPQMIGSERDPRIRRLAGKIDRVLVDAPCTGLGTLRRNPDMKWRQAQGSLAELAGKQQRILAASSMLLKPGGRLVYATCSLLPDENEQIVENFLESEPGQFRLVNAASLLKAVDIRLDAGDYFQVRPDTHGCDAFFAAVLERTHDGSA